MFCKPLAGFFVFFLDDVTCENASKKDRKVEKSCNKISTYRTTMYECDLALRTRTFFWQIIGTVFCSSDALRTRYCGVRVSKDKIYFRSLNKRSKSIKSYLSRLTTYPNFRLTTCPNFRFNRVKDGMDIRKIFFSIYLFKYVILFENSLYYKDRNVIKSVQVHTSTNSGNKSTWKKNSK